MSFMYGTKWIVIASVRSRYNKSSCKDNDIGTKCKGRLVPHQTFEGNKCIAKILGIDHYYSWLDGVVLVHAHNMKWINETDDELQRFI